MKTPAKISWIIPARNAGGYIGEAIASIQGQTMPFHEIVVVDDSSTDDTADVVSALATADPRIRLITLPSPSGSALSARSRGIAAATGSIIAPLDADDKVPPHYLEELSEVYENTGAEIVYPRMFGFEGSPLVPEPEGAVGIPVTGREMIKFTLDGWRMSCNGGLIDRDLYLEALEDMGDDPQHVFSDEMHTRRLLMKAERVVSTGTPYYYRITPDSTSRCPGLGRFGFIHNNRRLVRLTCEQFGRTSTEYRLAQRQNFHGVFDALRLLRHNNDPDIRREVMRMVEEARAIMDHEILRGDVSGLYYHILTSPLIPTERALRVIDSAKRYLTPLFDTLRRIRARSKRTSAQMAETWAVRRGHILPGSIASGLDARLYHDGEDSGTVAGVVCMCDGEFYHGGPTDRLRGILSAYSEAQRAGVPFFINWTSPFHLTDYLVPATFDWRVSPNQISHARGSSVPVVADDLNDFQSRMRIRSALCRRDRQIHLYTNADFAKGEYSKLYPKLFKPSPLLQKEVEHHLRMLGKNYMAVTTRFLSLLGDFKEWDKRVLDPEGQRILLDRVTEEFMTVTANVAPESRILVTSDSGRFLRHIAKLDPRVYVVPGEVRNIDLDHASGDARAAWLKTFTDQQLLMSASVVVRMRTGNMYPTGFPKFAAEIGGARFIDHVF